jgi:nitrate reductase molybdenum cofactor assembly chaperone NarJ/NarW
MTMTITYKALSALLAYPSADLVAALPEIAAIVGREPRLARGDKEALRALVAELGAADPLDAQEAYVALFDRGRTTSLHLFEHVHGDSRERGQAMVDLKEIYARSGFVLSANELPDFLPAVLEYLAQRPEAEAKDMLGDCAHILRAVGEALQDRRSHYAAVLAAALAMVGEPGLAAKRSDKPPVKERAIDDEWVDEPVIFGPAGAGGCGTGHGAAHPGFAGAQPGLPAAGGAGCGTPRPQTAVMQFTPRRA